MSKYLFVCTPKWGQRPHFGDSTIMANAIISPQIPNIDPLKWDLVFDETGEKVVFNPANIERLRSPGFITLRLTIASAFTFSKETTYCVTTSNNSGTYMCYGDSSKFAVGNVIYNGIIFNSFQSIDHPNGFFYFFGLMQEAAMSIHLQAAFMLK